MQDERRQYKIFLGEAREDLISALKAVLRANMLLSHTEELSGIAEEASISISMRIENMLSDLIDMNAKDLILDIDELAALDLALNLHRIRMRHCYSDRINAKKLLRLYEIHLEVRYHLMDPKFKQYIPP